MAPSPLQRPSTSETSQELKRVRERETELKRSRGEISCAECRRLKLRCDKKVPCSSCIRRGCETICPNGILSTGQGTRLVLADSDKLHRKLAEMARRIRQLEDALQIEHAGRSTSPHPLLSEDQLMIKTRIEGAEPVEVSKEFPEEEGLRQAFGVLALSANNTVRWLGVSGSEQTLLLSEMDSRLLNQEAEQIPESSSLFSTPIQQASQMWPFTPMYLTGGQLKEQLLAQLPTWDRANQLCEIWLENISWFHRPVKRRQIFEDLLPAAYHRTHSDILSDCVEEMDVHELALLFSLFSCGAAADLSLPVWNTEAETFQHLARAALGLRSVFDASSIASAQAICMISSYEVISGRKSSLESAWKTTSFAFTLAFSMGLHRDPARWGLDPKEVQLRRSVFWEMNILDNWKSLASGRPKTFDSETSDCELPVDDDATIAEDGSIIPSIWGWKFVFARDVLSHIVALLCSAKPPKYSEILDLDRRIRTFDYNGFVPVNVTFSDDNGPKSILQGISINTWFREVAMLYTHRNFFARAVIDHPTDPLRSSFAPSFLAAYRSASSLLRIMREFFDSASRLLIRLWPMWAHALASSVIVGSVVARAPASNLAPSAFVELELAIQLFTRAETHPVAKVGLPILRRIRDKAQKALYELRSGTGNGKSEHSGNHSSRSGQLPVIKSDEDPDDELVILRGQTKTIVKKLDRRSPGGSIASNTPAGSGSGSSPASMSSPEKTLPLGAGDSLASPSITAMPSDLSTERDPAVADVMTLFPSQSDRMPVASRTMDNATHSSSNTTFSPRSKSGRGDNQLMAELRKLASEMSVFVDSPPPVANRSQSAAPNTSTSYPASRDTFDGAAVDVTNFTVQQPEVITTDYNWTQNFRFEAPSASAMPDTNQSWSQQEPVHTQLWASSSSTGLVPSTSQSTSSGFNGLSNTFDAVNPSIYSFEHSIASTGLGTEQLTSDPTQMNTASSGNPAFTTDFPYPSDAFVGSEQFDENDLTYGKDWMNIVQDTGVLDPEELKIWEGFDF